MKRLPSVSSWAAPCLVAVLVGCAGADSEVEPPVPAPAWYGDVEPLVRQHCTGCHQAGGSAPFPLDDYATAAAWAGSIAVAVSERTMPPWLVTDDGTCGTFADSRWLDEDSIARIVAWAEAGAPEGDPALGTSDPPPAPPALDRVDVTLTTPTFVPVAEGSELAENDEYRCFLLDEPAAGDWFLTGFDVVPGNAAMVHHVLAMVVDPAAPARDGQPNAVHLAAMDGADGRPGWDCYGGAGEPIEDKGTPIVWAPGTGAVAYPSGIGIPIADGEVLVAQVHYNLVDPALEGQSDTTTIRLRTETSGVRPASLGLLDPLIMSIFMGEPHLLPPGEAAYSYGARVPVAQLMAISDFPEETIGQPVQLLGVMPHMHELGRQQNVRVFSADGTERCLADVARWDFNWQLWYFYEQPLTLAPNDEIEVSCTWDTRALTEPTAPGWGTTNEMCLASLMLAP